MEAKKIKIELELSPENALMVATFMHTTAQGDKTFYNMLSDGGKKEILSIAQNMVDQICDKTDHEELKMRNTHTFLKSSFLNESGNFNN